jgi:hypothetical protein
MTGNKRPGRSTAEHRPLWQRLIAGERLPKRLFRHPKCEGTIEDHRMIALDVRELIRKHVFDRPVGSAFARRWPASNAGYSPSPHRTCRPSANFNGGGVSQCLTAAVRLLH